jgi:hypothetical protein
MKAISIEKEHYPFIQKFAEHFTLNGFSNLKKTDLSKASRYQYNVTGVIGELGFWLYRYGTADKLWELMQRKVDVLKPLMLGDNGYDGEITSNGKTRTVDVKSSHVTDKGKIKYLNLIVPEREFHKNMIYVAAFTVGETREKVSEVVLAGWCVNEDIAQRWKYDDAKWAVSVRDLRPMEELEKYIR